MDPIDLTTLRREVDKARAQGTDQDARRLIRWAHDLLGGRLFMSTAFGKSGMVILHMVREIAPDLPVYFLNTGFHFSTTLSYAEELRQKWNLNLTLKRPRLFGQAFTEEHGEQLYRRDPDRCCHLNKTESFEEVLEQYQGWITGIRRDQGASRADAEPIEILEVGKIKIQPLVNWLRADVEEYVEKHKIPLHPLFDEGYTSIGCEPCTRRPIDPNDERSGRWVGIAKKECGLHTSWKKTKSEPDTKEAQVTKLPPRDELPRSAES